ncbi:cysteine proteinase [Polyplosphaeria fusca]|uniref:ubiquitinyl hydrolase 1 n=1 Tax=Polyplosphaeria fusca TaxID=682080 RepID=A0A9P4QN66_9PLEO|nr:cysteine proteinase [Polyplosphaeria fusca]
MGTIEVSMPLSVQSQRFSPYLIYFLISILPELSMSRPNGVARLTRRSPAGQFLLLPGLGPTTRGTRTALQRRRIADASRISKRWPISRRAFFSRGIENAGNTCYRNSTIQQLLHLPKFLNLLLSHNTPTGKEGCVRNPHWTWPAKSTTKKQSDPSNYQDQLFYQDEYCPACMLKDIVLDYWGTRHDDSEHESNEESYAPRHLPATLDSIRRMNAFGDRPENGGRVEGHGHHFYRHQGDAEEFQSRLVDASLNAADLPQDSVNWQAGFEALFNVDMHRDKTCHQCGFRGQNTWNSQFGFSPLQIRQRSPDTLKQSIERLLHQTPEGYKCENCNMSDTTQYKSLIEAAPEYLRLPLRLTSGTNMKNRNGVEIPTVLDLTNLQHNSSIPLLYQLNSVVLHSGENIHSGHNVAAVTCKDRRVYLPEDENVYGDYDPEILTYNPRIGGKEEFNAYILMKGSTLVRCLGALARGIWTALGAADVGSTTHTLQTSAFLFSVVRHW